MNKITYLDGTRWYRALIAGIRHVISRQDYLNNINVFPVPDRDTGTNIALTLNAIIEGTYAVPKDDIRSLFYVVADSALDGARGNSGAILAQFFQGMAEGIEGNGKKLEIEQFVVSVNKGVEYSYKALSQPKEGTILTVIKDFSLKLNQLIKQDSKDFVGLMHHGLQAANVSLQNTTNQLKELKKAQVVDAGGQGFVDLLQGIYDFILYGSLEDISPEIIPIEKKQISEEISHVVDEAHRFCTECLITGDGIDHDHLRQQLDSMGDCVVIAGSKRKTKIHIHTNDPSTIFNICREQGAITGEKADDMIQQQRAINHKRNEVAILTDSGADLPQSIIAELDIHVVPLQLQFGEQSYIDKVTITSEEFYELLSTNKAHPTTSQPSFGDFYRQYQYLSSHYPAIVAIHLPQYSSGTLSTSQAASKKFDTTNITIIDALSASVGQGLIVRRAAEAAKAGLNKDEIIKITREAIKRTKFYCVIPKLDFVAKGGRLSSRKKRFLEFFHLTPALSFNEQGKFSVAKLMFGYRNLAKKFARAASKQMDPQKSYRILVSYADCEHQAHTLQAELKKRLKNIESISIARTGATLGTHCGPDTFAVAFQEIF